MFNRKLFRHIDFILPALVLAIVVIGIIMIASSTHVYQTDEFRLGFVHRQILSAIVGILLMIITTLFDYRILKDYAYLIYGGTIFLLSINLVSGITGIAAKRTIFLGPLSFQPSEFAKLAVIILLAAILSQDSGRLTWQKVLMSCLVTVIPFLLILRTDLGTALVLCAILIISLFIAGLSGKYIAIFSGGALLLAGGWVFAHLQWGLWIPLKEYQLMRLMIFINPEMDPSVWGYQLIQSKIAIGSGGLLGKGLFTGTQTRLNFLPAQHTDFIFSVISEEFGFIGAFVLLILYLLVILRGLNVAYKSKDNFGTIIATSITGMIGFHIIVNVGMTMGILPITGLPLPFVSYGGSSLITNLVAVGLLMNIHMRRQKIYF